MAYYFIDYENVHDDGLSGVRDLAANDKVIVFYGTKIKTISFDMHIEMMNSKATVEYIETHKTAKNYLDFQLITYLGYMIGRGEQGPMVIVSKDLGFDSTVDFWKGRNIKISRRECIKDTAAKPLDNGKPAEAVKPSESPVKATEAPAKPSHRTQKAPDLPENIRKKVRAALHSDKLSSGNYTTIYRALENSADKLALNNTLVKAYGSEKGGEVYNRIKEIFGEYQNSKNP